MQNVQPNQAVHPAQRQAVLNEAFLLLTDGAETINIMLQVLNDAYFIHIKESPTYKDSPESVKEDLDFTFALVNQTLLKFQEVSWQ